MIEVIDEKVILFFKIKGIICKLKKCKMEKFIFAFFSLFITLDPVGVIPVFVGYTRSLSEQKRKKILLLSIFTCFFLGIIFLFCGEFLFSCLKISLGDFLIASGLILLVFSITEFIGAAQIKLEEDIAIVPLTIPMLAGPAFLTAVMVSKSYYGSIITLVALISNMVVATVILYFGQQISRFLGKAGIKGFIKILSLFLAALGIKFIREGIYQFLK